MVNYTWVTRSRTEAKTTYATGSQTSSMMYIAYSLIAEAAYTADIKFNQRTTCTIPGWATSD